MDRDKLKNDLMEVFSKYPKLVAIIIGFSYENDEGIMCYGNTFIPIPPRDHEEEMLRDRTAKKVSDLVEELTMNTYFGREEDPI